MDPRVGRRPAPAVSHICADQQVSGSQVNRKVEYFGTPVAPQVDTRRTLPLREQPGLCQRTPTFLVSDYALGRDRGSPNHGNTLLSKRVMAQIWSPVRVST
jgi:hypothetical protein